MVCDLYVTVRFKLSCSDIYSSRHRYGLPSIVPLLVTSGMTSSPSRTRKNSKTLALPFSSRHHPMRPLNHPPSYLLPRCSSSTSHHIRRQDEESTASTWPADDMTDTDQSSFMTGLEEADDDEDVIVLFKFSKGRPIGYSKVHNKATVIQTWEIRYSYVSSWICNVNI